MDKLTVDERRNLLDALQKSIQQDEESGEQELIKLLGSAKDEAEKLWKQVDLSLTQKFQVWNIYLAPILSYVEQVRELSKKDNLDLLSVLRKFVGGVNGLSIDISGPNTNTVQPYGDRNLR